MSDDYSYTRDVFEPIVEHIKEDAMRRKAAMRPPGTRVQFGSDGIRMQPTESLTTEHLADLLHEATVGCHAEDEEEHRATAIHKADAANLIAELAPYLYRHPEP